MRLGRIALPLFVLLTGLAAAGYAWVAADLPSLDTLPERLNLPSVRITDRFGRLLYEVLPEEGGRHAVVPLSPQGHGQPPLRRKRRELLLAWRLTRQLSKDEILALYLNQTYYGGLAYGVEAAAQTFYGRPPFGPPPCETPLPAGVAPPSLR